MRTYLTFLLFLLLGTSVSLAGNRYVGVSKCKSCHKREKAGAQYGIWSKGEHVKAFQSLGTPEARKLAVKLGFQTNPQEEKACLVCHLKSQYDEEGNQRPESMFFTRYKRSDGVQCEDCHGPGEKYVKKKIMKRITYQEGGAAKSATAKETGLWVPDEQTCRECHAKEARLGGTVYRNPTFQDFDYQKRLKEIAHPIPSK